MLASSPSSGNKNPTHNLSPAMRAPQSEIVLIQPALDMNLLHEVTQVWKNVFRVPSHHESNEGCISCLPCGAPLTDEYHTARGVRVVISDVAEEGVEGARILAVPVQHREESLHKLLGLDIQHTVRQGSVGVLISWQPDEKRVDLHLRGDLTSNPPFPGKTPPRVE
ncbi:hypothetical protein E2C01_012448 [Portunus trituberculatus]|uniref:Uncharacterized protein n=1 Tax=Portunus trituberculatus TaxID=210409 RepID=A0A5B7DE39_PORTR|nr:hypothetical protein [Portunus trituberculatus]